MTETVESLNTYTPTAAEPVEAEGGHGHGCACHQHQLSSNLLVKGLAELVGTFFVIMVLLVASTWTYVNGGSTVIAVALSAILAYGTAAATFGRVSGGHFNPAVTLAAALTSKISWLDALGYLIAQVIASIAAGAAFFGLLHLLPDITTQSGSIPAKTWWMLAVNGFGKNDPLGLQGTDVPMALVIIVEFIGALIVISSVIRSLRSNGSPKHSHVAATALAYGAATFLTFSLSGSSLNPARSTGVAIFAKVSGQVPTALTQLWVFWVVPLLAGAIVGTILALASTIGRANGEYAGIDEQQASTLASLPEQQDMTGFDVNLETEPAAAPEAEVVAAAEPVIAAEAAQPVATEAVEDAPETVTEDKAE